MRSIDIWAVSAERERVEFSFGLRMPLHKLMQAYARYFEIDRKNLNFRHAGMLLEDSDTPELLGMGNGCLIIVTDNVEDEVESNEVEEVDQDEAEAVPQQQ